MRDEGEDRIPEAPRDDPQADLLLKVGFGDKVRYDHLRSQWLWWNGVRWQPDRTRHVYDMIRVEAMKLFADAKSDDNRKLLMPMFDTGKKESILKSLMARPGIAMHGNEWDADPYLLGFDNGIMDLRTGEFDEHPSPDCLVSKTVGCKWDPDATCGEFDRFMVSIFPNDVEVLRYVMTLLGYSLFGLQSEQKFWMWVGRGSNGKGILARTMVHVLGDYAETPSDSMYMRTKVGAAPSNSARPDLVRLQGARFTYMSEPPGKQFNEELLKAHTGEDMVLARDLYSKAGQAAQFAPTHKIIFLTNDPPATEDVGISMRRRARMVRFDEDFTGPRADKKIEDRVKRQKQGILVRLVQFAMLWNRDGLTEADAVTRWSNEYMAENDPLAAWIEADCATGDDVWSSAAVLYGDYADWCARNGLDVVNNNAFANHLAKSYRKRRLATGVQYHRITLKAIENRSEGGDD